MGPASVGFAGAVASVAFFGFLSFSVWVDYRKKKDERDASLQERMKALELGYAPSDGEIERARAYASAAWAAGLIGLLVPLTLVLLTFIGTLVAVLNYQPRENITIPLIVAWSIAGVVSMVTAVRSLTVIRHLPRPSGETPPRMTAFENQASVASTHFRGERP